MNIDLQQARKSCQRLAKSHYENFVVASVLLPKRLRQPFFDVYAFCRTADDLADESPSPTIALERLDDFQQQLNDSFAGNPPPNEFLALADTIQRHDLPKQPFDDLLSAFRQDQVKTRYQDIDEVFDYCKRSANPVGRIVLSLADACSDKNAALSDKICTGLQLANFWQDVKRDRAIGRVYLPQDEMQQFNVSDQMLDLDQTPVELRGLLKSECDRAESLFRDGLPLVESVPSWLRKDIKLFAHGGLETLRAIRNVDFDVLRKRPKVSKAAQIGLIARAMIGLL